MVKPTPPIGNIPIPGAVTPPRIKLLLKRYKSACHVNPVVGFSNLFQQCYLLGCMADDIQELLVRPYIMLIWGDV